MSSYPSASSTPYRIPLIPPSQCSYISEFNQSLVSPSSRRIYAMQKRHPIEAETNVHKDNLVIAARINAAKVKFSLAILVILSLSSLLFTFFGLYILSIYLSFPPSYESISGRSSCKIPQARLISEIIISSAVISTISSLTTFFVTTVQLVVVFRMLKRCPTATPGVLRYLHNGRRFRVVAYIGWILSFLSFIIGFALYLVILSCQVGPIAQTLGAAFGVLSLLICTLSCLHTAYVFWSRSYSDQEDQKSGFGSDLSTLV